MSASTEDPKPPGAQSLLQTCVEGLDVVLGGGLPAGSLYLIQGLAGSGKTTLAGQIGFRHARQGKKVLVLTLLGESHGKMINHFANFSFFDDALVGKEIVFFSAYASLVKGGLRDLLQLIIATMSQQQPAILIIDGFRSVRNLSATDLAVAEFMHSLNSLVASMGCTTFLLSPVEGNVTDNENTLVDGVIELGQYRIGMGVIRELQVFKVRGAKHLLGRHVFEVKSEGLVVYPRFEAMVTHCKAPSTETHRLSVGIPSWDPRLGGGVIAGSITCLLGSPGAKSAQYRYRAAAPPRQRRAAGDLAAATGSSDRRPGRAHARVHSHTQHQAPVDRWRRRAREPDHPSRALARLAHRPDQRAAAAPGDGLHH